MRSYNKIVALLACCAIFAVPAEARKIKGGSKTYRGHVTKRAVNCPLHLTAEGLLADCHGWRQQRNATGWDNTCFRSLEHLPAMYACGNGNF
jgi:hypothetical protein